MGTASSCGTHVEDPYGDKLEEKDLKPLPSLTPEERQKLLDDITALPTVDIPSRSLKKAAAGVFRYQS